jgi:hypothetical protein
MNRRSTVGPTALPVSVVTHDVQDVTVLQYAATLEHLEDAFYSGALAKFDATAFAAAGFPDWLVLSRYCHLLATDV